MNSTKYLIINKIPLYLLTHPPSPPSKGEPTESLRHRETNRILTAILYGVSRLKSGHKVNEKTPPVESSTSLHFFISQKFTFFSFIALISKTIAQLCGINRANKICAKD